MKPLRVLLIAKPARQKCDAGRNMGYWSYSVPEFSWLEAYLGKHFEIDTRVYKARGFDLIVHEDGGNWGTYKHGALPVVYVSIDSTLSDEHYLGRLKQARSAQLVLLDQDRLQRWNDALPVPIQRWGYCVNDRVFHGAPAAPRAVDVAFHCAISSPGKGERIIMRDIAERWCEEHRSTFSTGPLGLDDYADIFRRSRVVLNWARVPTNRPHRLLDALASGACVLSGPVPLVDGLVPGKHFAQIMAPDLTGAALAQLRRGSRLWDEAQEIATAGHAFVMERHTWATRARQLRTILHETLGL